MAKKYPIGYIKDPKKVAAGKARAKKAIRVDGQYVKKDFVTKIEELAALSGAKDPFKFFLQNESMFSELYKHESMETSMNIDNLTSQFADKKKKGQVYINGKRTGKSKALQTITKLGQYLSTEHDLYNVIILYPKISMKGTIRMDFPTIKEIKQKITDGEDITSIMTDYNIVVMDKAGNKLNEIN